VAIKQNASAVVTLDFAEWVYGEFGGTVGDVS
jgi:hypothetical protein